ncbi:MAG: PPC domain-containing protein [Bacteroidota bacterium]
MRNLKVVFAFVFATIFMLTSCQKDQMQDVQATQKSSLTNDGDHLTGEELPTIESYDEEEIRRMRQDQITSFSKDVELGSMKFATTSNLASSRSRTVTPIDCGDVKSGTTRGETNTVDIYSGADKVYRVELDRAGKVEFDLSHMRSDLDLFVTELLEDNFGRQFIGNLLATSDNGGTDNERISLDLKAGKYFIVVETYQFGSDFKLSVNCENTGHPNPPTYKACEDYQTLRASYDEGISEQSNHWNLWSPYAEDGLVLYESSRSSNKVVKFDAQRFGYQDVVRDIIGLPLSRGYYFMDFDMWVAPNGVAEMYSEKTQYYGEEQGFKLKVQNEQLTITHKGQDYTAYTRIPSNTWHKVSMAFDLRENQITILINGIRIIMRANAQRNSSYNGQKSIQGIGFFTGERNSKFHIDNVCIEEVEPGYQIVLPSNIDEEVINLK